VVEANTEHRTPKTNSTESDKGAFVRRCLTETPNIRNTDIQRKAHEQGITISPAYSSEIRKAFLREQTAQQCVKKNAAGDEARGEQHAIS